MSVKTIFRVLLGTIIAIVMSSMLIELFNIHISGMQIRQMTKMAANQACILFTQETYKTDGSQGATKVENVKANDGGMYVTGDFYNGQTNAVAIWDSIFGDQSFLDFCNSSGRYSNNITPNGYSTMKDVYPDLEIMQTAVQSGGSVSIPSTPGWDAGDDSPEVIRYTNALKAQTYYDTMFTTVNLGIPYLDDEIVNKMFRWNLAQILSNCSPQSIQVDEDGQYFINYKGFRCYAQAARIVNYEYRAFDMTNSSDANEFKRLTGMNPSQLGISSNDDNRTDNNMITIVGINYQIPISYQGITPIKRIFNYTWNQEVKGFKGQNTGYPNKQQWANEALSTVDNGVSDGIEYLEAGGIQGSNSGGELDAAGELTYTLVR